MRYAAGALSLLFFLLSLYVTAMNIWGTVAAMRWRRQGIDRGYSQGGFISLLSALLAWGIGASVFGTWARWMMLPTLFDPGTWLILFFPFALYQSFRPPQEDKSIQQCEER